MGAAASSDGGPLVVAVASGKGGTGKTTVAVSLALTAPSPAVYADCDVEEPDGALFLHPAIDRERPFTQLLPVFVTKLCDGCGVCHDVCEYKAILVADTPLLFADRCHACGACAALCPRGAIREEPVERGAIRSGHRNGLAFVEGRLRIGEASPTALVREVRALAVAAGRRLVILDAAPGTSCPVIAAAHRADFLLLVTEPTPAGVADLARVADLAAHFGVPAAVVLNKADLWPPAQETVTAFCASRSLPYLGAVPYDTAFHAAARAGRSAVEVCSPMLAGRLLALWEDVRAFLDEAARARVA